VSSYDYLASTGVIPLGNLLVGVVAAAAGIYPTLYAMTAIGMASAVGVFAIPAVRHLPRGAAPVTGRSDGGAGLEPGAGGDG
jgi:hypothetical protein